MKLVNLIRVVSGKGNDLIYIFPDIRGPLSVAKFLIVNKRVSTNYSVIFI